MDYDEAYAITTHTPGAEALLAGLPDRSAAFRTSLGARTELDHRYGASARQLYDVYRPDRPPKGTLIFVHGGYWRGQHGRTYGYLAAGAVARGWQSAHPSYDLCPTVRIRDITRQIAKAITAIAGKTEGPLSLAGHSAGGHLVARMLDRSLLVPEVAGRLIHVLPISPLTDLRPLMHTAMNDDFEMDAAEAVAESPVLMSDRYDVPVTVVVGADERPALLDQSRWLSEAWGAPCEIVPDRHHFDVIDALTDPDNAFTRLLTGS